MSGKKSGMKKVIESTNLEEQLTRHHEGDSDYTHQGTGSSKKVLIAAVCLTLGYAVIEVIGGFLSNSLALLSDAGHMVPTLPLSSLRCWLTSWPAVPQAASILLGLQNLKYWRRF